MFKFSIGKVEVLKGGVCLALNLDFQIIIYQDFYHTLRPDRNLQSLEESIRVMLMYFLDFRVTA